MAIKKTATPGKTSERDYLAIAAGYCAAVLSGEIPAGQWVRKACARQVADLARKDWGWRFDRDRAEKICRFIELLPHVKGKWKSRTIVLEPWQIFHLTTIFGWVDAEGNRRFRTVYIEIPRKNAKSTETSGVGLYMLCADGEPGANVFSAATTREQARIVFDDARAMARLSPGLLKRFDAEVLAHAITSHGTTCSFRPISAEASTQDGLNIHCGLVDEVHAHKDRALWDVLRTATGSRSQPLLWAITTAGFNRAGVCYEQRAYVIKILDGVQEDETYFGIIYGLDDGDDWTEESSWRKANPNYGISVSPDDLASKCRQAQASAASQNGFLTKHLDEWVNADTAWASMQAWDKCRCECSEDEFENEPCFIGLDLASKIDIAAKMLLFERDGLLYVFGRYYLPEDLVDAGSGTNAAHYAGWARAGKLVLTPGNITDFEFVKADIIDDMRRFDVQQVGYDPFQATFLATQLLAENVPMVEVPQTVRSLSEPMKAMEAAMLSGRLRHNGDPVLAWMVSNVVGHYDVKENIYPRKDRPENKIDGVVAALSALSLKLRAEDAYAPMTVRSVG